MGRLDLSWSATSGRCTYAHNHCCFVPERADGNYWSLGLLDKILNDDEFCGPEILAGANLGYGAGNVVAAILVSLDCRCWNTAHSRCTLS
jgi:hypothetical protein